MKDLYSGKGSDYLQKTSTWHSEDSPWKAGQIHRMIMRNGLTPGRIVEVGCGVGEILYCLNDITGKSISQIDGFDIAIDAIEIAKRKGSTNLHFYCEDFLFSDRSDYDLLLMIDVFEHIPDYLGFLEKCKSRAEYKIYHIPLDVHVSSILRNKLVDAREKVGHLHYFTKETALATLKDTGHEIIDFFYTDQSTGSPNKGWKTRIANIPRLILHPLFPNFTVKLLGGYSLMVLAK